MLVWRLLRPILVFWILIRTLVSIITLLVIAKGLYLAEVFLNPFVLLDSDCIHSCWRHIALPMPITLLVRTRIFLIWLKNDLPRLDWLSTSIISKTSRRKFLSLNILLKILDLKSSITSSIPTICLFCQRHKMLNNFSFSISCFVDWYFPDI